MLIGGLDLEKREEVVKLFRIKIEEKIILEFLNDIILYDKDSQKSFLGSVDFVVKEDDGGIKFGFYNTIYACEKPQLDAYIKDEK